MAFESGSVSDAFAFFLDQNCLKLINFYLKVAIN